jgi:hypothetical protein
MAKNDIFILAAIAGAAILLSGKNPIDILGGFGGNPAQGGNGDLFSGFGDDASTFGTQVFTAAPKGTGGTQAQGGDFYNGFTPANLPEGISDPNGAVGTGGGLVIDSAGNYRFRSGGFVGVSSTGAVIPASFGSASLTPAQKAFLTAAEQGKSIGQASSKSKSIPSKNKKFKFVGGVASGANQNFTPVQNYSSNQNFSSIFG